MRARNLLRMEDLKRTSTWGDGDDGMRYQFLGNARLEQRTRCNQCASTRAFSLLEPCICGVIESVVCFASRNAQRERTAHSRKPSPSTHSTHRGKQSSKDSFHFFCRQIFS